ncbi:MAG: DUF4013 domain-containing protein [Candidatus Dormiibacterota bacterium]
MNTVGDAFTYPFRDPGWAGKIGLQGLILIIPIVGWISTAGWLMLTYDNLRAGRQELAPAGFHLERGIGIFGVVVIYGIVVNIPASILDGIGSAMSRNNSLLGSPFSGLGSLWSFAAQLLIDFLMPSLIVLTARNGFSGGLDIQRVWALATSQVNNSIIGGLVIFAAGVIGALGFIACCIGVFFTLTYAAAVNAGVAAWFERMQAAPAPGVPAA